MLIPVNQIKYSPRRLTGFGLTDGEVLERLWSYLRRFGKMTKEMRPSHRIDVLSDAILHYGRMSVAKLGKVINLSCTHMKRRNSAVREKLMKINTREILIIPRVRSTSCIVKIMPTRVLFLIIFLRGRSVISF
jgi:hypothetical protein